VCVGAGVANPVVGTAYFSEGEVVGADCREGDVGR